MPRYESLERKRRQILAHIAQIQSMRRGYLNKRFNVCGKPLCRCKAKPPKLHGPYFFITTKVEGKTRCHYVADRDRLALLREQLRAHQRFRRLIQDFVGVCEQIADWNLKTRKECRNESVE